MTHARGSGASSSVGGDRLSPPVHRNRPHERISKSNGARPTTATTVPSHSSNAPSPASPVGAPSSDVVGDPRMARDIAAYRYTRAVVRPIAQPMPQGTFDATW